MKGWRSIYHANGSEKKTRVAIFISKKNGLKTQSVTRNKEGHYIIIKRTTQQEDGMIVNIYAPNMGAPKHIRQFITNIKEVINTVIVEDFHTPLISMDRSSKQNQQGNSRYE